MVLINYNEHEIKLQYLLKYLSGIYKIYEPIIAISMLIVFFGLCFFIGGILSLSGMACFVGTLMLCGGLFVLFFIKKKLQLLPNTTEMRTAWNSIIKKIKSHALNILESGRVSTENQFFIISPDLITKNTKRKLFLIKGTNDNLYYSQCNICLFVAMPNSLFVYTACADLCKCEIYDENVVRFSLKNCVSLWKEERLVNDNICCIDVDSLPSKIKKPKDKNAFFVTILKEPQQGWRDSVNFNKLNFEIINNNCEVIAVPKTTELDEIFLSHCKYVEQEDATYCEERSVVLLSTSLKNQIGITDNQDTEQIYQIIEDMIAMNIMQGIDLDKYRNAKTEYRLDKNRKIREIIYLDENGELKTQVLKNEEGKIQDVVHFDDD